MRREIQVHFENCGQLQWHDDIDDVDEYLCDLTQDDLVRTYDKETGRHFCFSMDKVTAIIVVNKVAENDNDLFRRAYAVNEEKSSLSSTMPCC